jgi:hypothetical protein
MKHAIIIIAILIASTFSAIAQHSSDARGGGNPSPNTNSKMLFHDGGQVIGGTPNVYFIWYGCWGETCGNFGSPASRQLVEGFTQIIGGSPYFQMNRLYPGGNGSIPSGGLIHGWSVDDHSYSHGFELTQTDIESIVREQIESGALPQDPAGMYIVIASADIAASTTGFCTVENIPPLHWRTEVFGSMMFYGFLGNPARCPTSEAPQFSTTNGTRLPTPNDDFAGDSIITNLAHLLNTMVTDPNKNAWYDRYGLENADKCYGTFGTTWTTANGARANYRIGGRDFLIGQNWINDKRQKCGMQLYTF